MHADLLFRIRWFLEKGEKEPYSRLRVFLNSIQFENSEGFSVNGRKYFWNKFNSQPFEDLILETYNEWLYIVSDNRDFEGLLNIYSESENLIGQKDHPKASTMWILRSAFPGIEVSEHRPIKIWLPEFIHSPFHRIEPDLKRIIEKLSDKNIPVKELVEYKINKSGERKIR